MIFCKENNDEISYLIGSMTTLDSVLLAVMEMDMSQVMNELCNTLDNFWYPAHLLDLLHHSGNLESNLGQQNEQIQAGASLREFLLLEYATCLMTHNSLWQVGALYFDHCQVQGKQRLELLLERVPLTSGNFEWICRLFSYLPTKCATNFWFCN